MKILLIEDDAVLCKTLAKVLRKYHHVDAFTDSQKALNHLSSTTYDVVLTDVRMPGVSGIDILQHVMTHSPGTHVILFTGYGTVDEAVRAIKMGAYDYILKPIDTTYLLLKLEKLEEMNCDFLAKSEVNLVYQSQAMKTVVDMALKVAQTDSTVLLTGETGVGKNLVAKLIHLNSKRKSRKFLSFNCANLQESLFEGELFGYRKGAFTGAVNDKKGIIELAHRGTLVIDEITEMPVNIQAKFLKFLEEKAFFKLGDNEQTRVDVRIITITNKDIESLVKNGKFREDLFYRINVFRIHIPPLRDRKEDIPVLARYFLDKFKEINPGITGVSDEAMEKLMAYDYPGNVRELSNIMERAMILSRGERWILPHHITTLFGKPQVTNLSLDELTRRHILSVLQFTGGDKSKAAKILGIDRSTLYRKLKEYGIEV